MKTTASVRPDGGIHFTGGNADEAARIFNRAGGAMCADLAASFADRGLDVDSGGRGFIRPGFMRGRTRARTAAAAPPPAGMMALKCPTCGTLLQPPATLPDDGSVPTGIPFTEDPAAPGAMGAMAASAVRHHADYVGANPRAYDPERMPTHKAAMAYLESARAKGSTVSYKDAVIAITRKGAR